MQLFHVYMAVEYIYFLTLQIIFDGTFGINSMQISNRANGDRPRGELNKRVRLTFSNGYTTEVNALVQSLTMVHQTMGNTNILPNPCL